MFDFKFADIGEGIHEGKLLEYLVEEGEEIKNGQSLFLVETDKVNAEIPSPIDGIVDKLLFSVGDMIKVGDTVVKIRSSNQAVEEEETAGVVGEIKVSNEIIPSFIQEKKNQKKVKKRVLATPVARKLAKDLGVDIKEVEGSGFNGRVMKRDISEFAENKSTAVAKTIESKDDISIGRREKMSSIRKSIFEAMEKSKGNIPHTVLFREIEVDRLVELRKELNAGGDIHITYLPFIIKAMCLAIRDYPIFNAVIDGEDIIYKDDVNIGIGVDTEFGLMLPVIKKAQEKSMLFITNELKKLAEKARKKELKLEQISNGSISLTNFGRYAKYATPIIKYPQVAILGLGSIKEEAIVREGRVEVATIMHISLAADHRIIDGGDIGRFIDRFEELIKNPKLLLLS